MNRRAWSLSSLAALLFVCLAQPLLAAPPTASEVQRALDSDAGWKVHKLDAKGGVDVYKKDIAGIELPAFKGVKAVDVDSSLFFDAVVDFENHVGLSDDIPLKRSVVLRRAGAVVDFWQYLDVPGWTLANDRYWFLQATIVRRVGGVAGHHKQTWDSIDPATYSQAWADARAIDEDAVMTSLNHGSWEVVPLADGRTKVIYRVVSDPGGRIPRGAQALATGTTLPDNILSFEAEAKRRAQAGR